MSRIDVGRPLGFRKTPEWTTRILSRRRITRFIVIVYELRVREIERRLPGLGEPPLSGHRFSRPWPVLVILAGLFKLIEYMGAQKA